MSTRWTQSDGIATFGNLILGTLEVRKKQPRRKSFIHTSTNNNKVTPSTCKTRKGTHTKSKQTIWCHNFHVCVNCKRSIYWMQLKKSLGFILVASLIFLIFCFIFPQTNALGFLDFSCKSDDNLVHTTIKSVEKTSMLHHDHRKSKLSMSSEMTHLMEASSGKYSYGQGNPSELEISQQLTHKSKNHEQTSHVLDIQSERKLSSSVVQNSDPLGYLTVKTGKEKGRRRMRKSLDAKLEALSEVSSSQSGNSTPSSSLSCIPSATPKCNWPMSPDEEQPLEGPSSMTQVATQHSANDQAFATVVVSNILKPASTQRFTKSKSSQVPHSTSRSATSFLKYHKYYFMTKTSIVFTHLRL
ncbi:hypothetical protein JHK86_001617 [Glycine max]|nr:hypothetical protein JHK86_001617 [Glycine max]